MQSNNDPGNPFLNLEKEIDDEQLNTWQQMNKQSKGLVQYDSDHDAEAVDVILDDSLLVADNSMEVDISGYFPKDPNDEPAQGPSGVDMAGQIPIKGMLDLPTMDITLQYLAGKISFIEFMDIMEKDKAKVDTGQDIQPEVGQDVDDTGDNIDINDHKKRGKDLKDRKPRKRRHELPKHLQNSMGEVSMTYAMGNHESAIQQCMEIIRMAPNANKPFQTLAMIYEDLGDLQKSLQYGLIAAYLDPRDGDEWAKLGEMCVEQNDINQAMKCYTQGIAANGENKADCIWEKSRLYEELKEYKKSLEGYQMLLGMYSKTEGDKYFKLAWAITRSYYELGEKSKALETITQAFKDQPEQITSEDVNLLLELQMPEKKYIESLDVFVQHCGVVFIFHGELQWSKSHSMKYEDIQHRSLVSCEVPDMLPLDLRSKLSVCMIYLSFIKPVKEVIAPLYDEDIEVNGDLYLDIAEAYMDKGYHKHAEPLLKKLVNTQNYHLAAVWLRYGECQKYLGDVKGAVRAYSWVVQLAPSHIGARMSLSALQQQLGKHKEALDLLKHDEFEDRTLSKEEQLMLLQKCHLLNAQGNIDEFLSNAKQLLFQEWRDVEAENMNYLQAIRTYKHRKETLLNHFDSKGKDILKYDPLLKTGRYCTYKIPLDDLWDMFKTLCGVLIEKKRYVEFEEITLLGMLCPVFMQDDKMVADFEFFILTTSLYAKNANRAYAFARHFVLENLENNNAWNMFMQVIMMCDDVRHNRFCLRKMLHAPHNIPLGIMNGHNSMASGSYKHSLGEYSHIFRRIPTDPMISLCVGLDLIHSASQKFSAKRHYLVTQGMTFLNNYAELRGECQEVNYNLGRALHQMNILYAAVHYYNKVLAMPPCFGDKGSMFDLTMQAAFNMSLIYKTSGNPEYAKYLLYKYCTL